MNRTDFFKQTILGLIALIFSRDALAGSQKMQKEIRLCSPFIAGFQYYDGYNRDALIQVNDDLKLQREPKNSYDYYAIKIAKGNSKLGYIPRKDNKVIARLLDQGVAVKARIVAVDPEADSYRKVKIKVFYEG